MNTWLLRGLVGAAAFSALTLPAAAQSFRNFYVGTDVGFENSGRIDQGGATYGAFAGYNQRLGNSLLLGVEGRYGDSSITETRTRTTTGFQTVSRNSVGRHYGVAGRIGAVVSEGTLFFGRLGWENVAVRAVQTRTPIGSTTTPNPTVTDFSFDQDTLVVGGGVEHLLGKKVAARFTYDYGEKLDRHQVRLGLVLGF